MESRKALGLALKTIRSAKGVSQESFSDVSSRTYLSTLERGMKSPTLAKLEVICEAMQVHPLTLLTLALSHRDGQTPQQLALMVERELAGLATGETAP